MELLHEDIRDDRGLPSDVSELSKQVEYMRQAMEEYEDTSAVPLSFSVYPSLQGGTALPSTYRYCRLASSTTLRLINL
jgi:hypothetical protein